MCYAIPGKLVEIRDNIGIIDYFGEKKRARIDYSDVSIGDYVYAQGGLLINKIKEKEALEILDAWKELFFELKKIDAKLPRVQKSGISESVLEALNKVNSNRELSKEELLSLLKIVNKDELRLTFETANNIRQKKHGNACCVHGIIEFSNYCQSNCFYCGIRSGRDIKRYRIDVDEIISIAKDAVIELNFKAIVLQSGEDIWYEEEKLIYLVKELRKLNILIFLSIGDRSPDTYKKLYEAGARGALLRFETSNKDIFNKIKPDTTLENRLELIKNLKSLGFVLATGFLVGLPEETCEDIINNILLTKSLKPDMYSLGPFIPVKDTPLEKSAFIDKNTLLKTIAICRLADNDANILVTSALETQNSAAKKEGLLAGANSLMVNITPKEYRSLYRIYDERAGSEKGIKENINDTLGLLYSLGRAPTDLGVK